MCYRERESYIHIYIYIYREREREIHIHIYIYIYTPEEHAEDCMLQGYTFASFELRKAAEGRLFLRASLLSTVG